MSLRLISRSFLLAALTACGGGVDGASHLKATKRTVPVAVLDNGVDANHPALKDLFYKDDRGAIVSKSFVPTEPGSALIEESVPDEVSEQINLRYLIDYYGDYFHSENKTNPDPSRFATFEDFEKFLSDMINKKLEIEKELSEKGMFGKFNEIKGKSHGTAIASIITRTSPASRIIPIKIYAYDRSDTSSDSVPGDAGVADEVRLKELEAEYAAEGDSETQIFLDALSFAAQHAPIVSMSFSTGLLRATEALKSFFSDRGVIAPSEDDLKRMAMESLNRTSKMFGDALKQFPNTLFVFSASNRGQDESIVPCGIDVVNVICVGAYYGDKKQGYYNYGNSGNSVDVYTRGIFVKGAVVGGAFSGFNGTSYATPLISGLASLILSESDEELSVESLRTQILTRMTRIDLKDNGEYPAVLSAPVIIMEEK